jgi:hypothetical protein
MVDVVRTAKGMKFMAEVGGIAKQPALKIGNKTLPRIL